MEDLGLSFLPGCKGLNPLNGSLRWNKSRRWKDAEERSGDYRSGRPGWMSNSYGSKVIGGKPRIRSSFSPYLQRPASAYFIKA